MRLNTIRCFTHTGINPTKYWVSYKDVMHCHLSLASIEFEDASSIKIRSFADKTEQSKGNFQLQARVMVVELRYEKPQALVQAPNLLSLPDDWQIGELHGYSPQVSHRISCHFWGSPRETWNTVVGNTHFKDLCKLPEDNLSKISPTGIQGNKCMIFTASS